MSKKRPRKKRTKGNFQESFRERDTSVADLMAYCKREGLNPENIYIATEAYPNHRRPYEYDATTKLVRGINVGDLVHD